MNAQDYLFLNSKYKGWFINTYTNIIALSVIKPSLLKYCFITTKIIMLLLPIILFIETFYVKKLEYFFYSSALMILPIIFTLYLFGINRLYAIECSIIKDTVIIDHIVDNPNIQIKPEGENFIIEDNTVRNKPLDEDYNVLVEMVQFQKKHDLKDISVEKHIRLRYLQDLNLLSYTFKDEQRIRSSFVYNDKIFEDKKEKSKYFSEFLKTHKEEIFNSIEDKMNICKKVYNINYHLKELKTKYDKKSTLLMLITYFTCWLYILVISLPNFTLLPWEELFLKHFQDILEPFADTPLI